MQPRLEEKFVQVLGATAQMLIPFGFKKRRLSFRRKVASNVAVVEFQRSQANGADRLRFTVNLAVLSAAVTAVDGGNVDTMGASEGHLRERIGSLIGKGDFWWEVGPGTNLEALSSEVAYAIRDYAVPYLDGYAGDEALRTMWRSGRSPGLTEVQRVRFLTALGG